MSARKSRTEESKAMLSILIAVACLVVIVSFAGELIASLAVMLGGVLAFVAGAWTVLGVAEFVVAHTHQLLTLELACAIHAAQWVVSLF